MSVLKKTKLQDLNMLIPDIAARIIQSSIDSKLSVSMASLEIFEELLLPWKDMSTNTEDEIKDQIILQLSNFGFIEPDNYRHYFRNQDKFTLLYYLSDPVGFPKLILEDLGL